MRIASVTLATLATALAAGAQPGQQMTCTGQTCTFPLSFEDAALYLVGTTGAAFSGQEQDSNSSTLPNGTHLSNQNLRDMTYRDSKGRVRTERYAIPFNPQGRPANPNDFVIAEIHDPVAGFVYILDPVGKTAYRMAIPKNLQTWDLSNIASMEGASGPNTVITFLGARTMSGANANGYRSSWTRTDPAGNTFVITTEDWYALATGVRLLKKQTFTGNDNINTTTETNYSEAEPEASLFQIPDGYKTVDETGPFQVVHPETGGARVNSGGTGPQLMAGACEEGACTITYNPGNAPATTALTGAPYSGHEILTSIVNNKPFVGKPNGTGRYRDSNGRTRTDPVQPSGGMAISASVTLVKIEDPVAGYVYIVSPAIRTAYRIQTSFRSFAFQPNQNMAQQAGTRTMPNGSTVAIENLPPQTISGIAAVGQRNTRTDPPGTYNGNDKTVVTVNERWIDPKTGIVIQTSNTGLRADTTTTMPDYKEGDPDPALFQIPAGYKVIDEPGKFSFDVPIGSK